MAICLSTHETNYTTESMVGNLDGTYDMQQYCPTSAVWPLDGAAVIQQNTSFFRQGWTLVHRVI